MDSANIIQLLQNDKPTTLLYLNQQFVHRFQGQLYQDYFKIFAQRAGETMGNQMRGLSDLPEISTPANPEHGEFIQKLIQSEEYKNKTTNGELYDASLQDRDDLMGLIRIVYNGLLDAYPRPCPDYGFGGRFGSACPSFSFLHGVLKAGSFNKPD